MHLGEVQVIMRNRVGEREKLPQEVVQQALQNFKAFIQNVKHKKVEESPLHQKELLATDYDSDMEKENEHELAQILADEDDAMDFESKDELLQL